MLLQIGRAIQLTFNNGNEHGSESALCVGLGRIQLLGMLHGLFMKSPKPCVRLHRHPSV